MTKPRRARPFLIEVAPLRRAVGSSISVERLAVARDLDDELAISTARVPDDETVGIVARLESVSGGVVVTGTVRASWEGLCRRCLEMAHGPITAEVREWCAEEGDEESTYPISPYELDLEPIVHDACILELPLAPLCKKGCLGICPECGADRNHEPCSCVVPNAGPFAGLSVLLGPIDNSVEANNQNN